MKARRNIAKIVYQYLIARANTLSFKGIFIAITQSKASNLKPVDIVFWCHDNHRNAWFAGKRYAPLIDTIIDSLDSNVSHMTLAGPFSRFYGESCYGNVVVYNRTLLCAYIKRFILYQSLTIKSVQTDSVVKAWKKILVKTQPKAIIGITPSPELCIAAKQLGIWIADMQHGVLAPGNFYDARKRAVINQQGWPDEILCWDEFSKKFVESHLIDFVHPRLIGHPAYFSKANRVTFELPENPSMDSEKISVLVTLTWHLPVKYANDPVFQAIGMPSSLSDYIKLSGDFCNWNLRMHPAQAMKRKAEVFKELRNIFQDMDNVYWEQCNNETLHDAFQKSTVHITFDSASTREAAILGINTAVLDDNEENAKVYFGDLITEGKVVITSPADSHKNFTEWILQSQQAFELAQLEQTNAATKQERFQMFTKELQSRLLKLKKDS